MIFNEKLKSIRQISKHTQHDVANYLGISDRAYQHYELGTREPNLETLLKISLYFNISLDDLLCRQDFIDSHEVYADES